MGGPRTAGGRLGLTDVVTFTGFRTDAERLIEGFYVTAVRALVSLLLDPSAARELGAGARALAVTRSHERLVDRMAELYAAFT